jgi:hypothetical protein
LICSLSTSDVFSIFLQKGIHKVIVWQNDAMQTWAWYGFPVHKLFLLVRNSILCFKIVIICCDHKPRLFLSWYSTIGFDAPRILVVVFSGSWTALS